jgi:hypothetical protein
LVVAALSVDAAAAASITNRDERDQKVLIMAEGEGAKEQILKPNAVISDVCRKGCIVRLNDNQADEYELEGPEIVSIEDGLLYYDGPEVPAEPSAETGKADSGKR